MLRKISPVGINIEKCTKSELQVQVDTDYVTSLINPKFLVLQFFFFYVHTPSKGIRPKIFLNWKLPQLFTKKC